MFRKSAPPASDSRQARRDELAANHLVEERRVTAWIGRSIVIKGDLTSSEDLTIAGQVEGAVSVPDHCLTIGPHASIRADIVARVVKVHGVVVGTITASEKVEIGETGSVEGDIFTPRLAVAEGGLLQGQIGVEAYVAAT